jgi:hypothetical protein
MMQIDTQQNESGTTAVRDREGRDAPVVRTDDVSWYLSPGYGAHLHAYELAMLPGDRRVTSPTRGAESA